ncbi:probable ascorbate-specific transmembrane electron transporter 1 [Juglans microcarpa x Juglans regia]|uniref:probable ascorbate-specific transmembrane electron transporter 1 n=1 Tax=Juglans microcarpa x Juglans regia TaxID=2249226 RepID=UPI001B7F2176|nr:probable ascorbate-specific transmembrane electron transporter 1 [Juglans microcarpa x Juglans regia]
MAPKSRSYQLSATPFVIFAQLLAIAVTTLVFVLYLHFEGGFAFKSEDKTKIFNVHPFLMVLGLIIIGGEAIMAYKIVPGDRRTQKGVHLILHLLALTAGILGIVFIFRFHNEIEAKDMQTLHSWMGIITISLYGLQWVLAFFAYCFPGGEMSRRGTLLPWHTFVGMVIFLLAVTTALTGLSGFSNYLLLSTKGYILNFTGLFILLFAITVTLTVILPRGY